MPRGATSSLRPPWPSDAGPPRASHAQLTRPRARPPATPRPPQYDNNYYLGTLFQLDKDAATQDVELAPGDSLTGDTLRSTLAEVIARCVELGTPSGQDFTVVNRKGTPPSAEQIEARLRAIA